MLSRVWRYAARLDVAASILFILVLLTAAGSFFPQLAPEIAADPQRLAAWADGLRVQRAQRGGFADFLLMTGAVRFFGTPVFLIPWALLLLATLLCTLNRWRGVWRGMVATPVCCPAVLLETAPHTACLRVPADDQAMAALRRSLEARGFRVSTEVVDGVGASGWTPGAETTDVDPTGPRVSDVGATGRSPLRPTRTQTEDAITFLRADRNRLGRLATLVTHLAILLLLVGILLNVHLGWHAELVLPPGEAVEVGHATGLQVINEKFAVTRYPDGNVASYDAAIRLQDVRARIRVNEPFVYRGVGFYLKDYRQLEGQATITLLAAYDPGYGPIVVAGFLLLIGMTVTFTCPYCRVRARLAKDGTLRLGGWAERHAVGFAAEFSALAGEVQASAAHIPGGQAS